jgi:hypothetical protein
VRALRKQRGFSAVAILTLAVGDRRDDRRVQRRKEDDVP